MLAMIKAFGVEEPDTATRAATVNDIVVHLFEGRLSVMTVAYKGRETITLDWDPSCDDEEIDSLINEIESLSLMQKVVDTVHRLTEKWQCPLIKYSVPQVGGPIAI